VVQQCFFVLCNRRPSQFCCKTTKLSPFWRGALRCSNQDAEKKEKNARKIKHRETENNSPRKRKKVTTPIHESCTACIVGAARGTSAMTSDSGGEHTADSVSGPAGCPRYREKLPHKVQRPGGTPVEPGGLHKTKKHTR